MEKFKMNLDREPLSSERIQHYQDFNRLKNEYIHSKKTIWKSPWFWGTGGIASLLLIASTTSLFHEKNSMHEEKITLNNTDENHKIQPISEEDYPLSGRHESSAIAATSEVEVKDNQTQIKRLEAMLAQSDFLPDSQQFHFRIDALADEFPEVYPLVGKRLEVLAGQRVNKDWFALEWEQISVKSADVNRYTILFSKKNESKAVKVKVVYEGMDLDQEYSRLDAENKEIRTRINALRASL
jgi:hypothetical protein